MTRKACLGITGAAILLGGCAPKTPPSPLRPDPDLRVALQLSPPSPRQLDVTTFTVRLKNSRGQPISEARVLIDLSMPAMEMGRNQVTPVLHGQGVYIGTGRFTMAGEWQATITVSGHGRRTTQAFPLQVR